MLSLAGADLLGLHRARLVPEVLEEERREVALAEGRDDDDDALARVLGALADDLRREDGGARRDAAEDALLLGEAARHADRVLARDLHDLIDERRVGVARDEARADALDLVRARRAAAQDGRLRRLDRDDFERGLEGLEVLGAARDRAPRAHAASKMSSAPSVSAQISGPVVSRCTFGLSGLL